MGEREFIQPKNISWAKKLPFSGALSGTLETNMEDFPFCIFFDLTTGFIESIFIYHTGRRKNVVNTLEVIESEEFIIDRKCKNKII